MNAVDENDIEHIPVERKSGGYRHACEREQKLSTISKNEYGKWFQQFWNLSGASTKQHPAPFPLELAYRLVRMFSFWGDTVVDPFCGSGTTMLAAMKAGRNSIGIEIDSQYCKMTEERLRQENSNMFSSATLEFVYPAADSAHKLAVASKKGKYTVTSRKTAKRRT